MSKYTVAQYNAVRDMLANADKWRIQETKRAERAEAERDKLRDGLREILFIAAHDIGNNMRQIEWLASRNLDDHTNNRIPTKNAERDNWKKLYEHAAPQRDRYKAERDEVIADRLDIYERANQEVSVLKAERDKYRAALERIALAGDDDGLKAREALEANNED